MMGDRTPVTSERDSATGRKAVSVDQGGPCGLSPTLALAPRPRNSHLPSLHHQHAKIQSSPVPSPSSSRNTVSRSSALSSNDDDSSALPLRHHTRGPLQSIPIFSSPVSSTVTSPHDSRESSPVRRDSHPSTVLTHTTPQPSAAAIQRALSASSITQISYNGQKSDAISSRPRVRKGVADESNESTLHWPISPRLKSPPPRSSYRRSNTYAARTGPTTMEQSGPSLNMAGHDLSANDDDISRKPDGSPHNPLKNVARPQNTKAMLETVQENSLDSVDASSTDLGKVVELNNSNASNDDADATPTRSTYEAERPTESGSESAGTKSDHNRGRRQSLGMQNTVSNPLSKATSKGSYGTLTTAKARQAEGKHAMTVETETVPSIPQSGLNPVDRRSENGGSVRLKPSNETIRPKRERKKVSSKARSITQGTGSTKADIFEARVASAVDAHSSDSDDTFVYESNPPEPQRARRHHSRTPSVTSAHSVADQRSTIRAFTDADDRKVAGKRSMKFSSHHEQDPADSKSTTLRSHRPRRLRSDREVSHPSMLDHDSLFTQASKLRSMTSRPTSPRSPHLLQSHQQPALLANKSEHGFDLDGAVADDECTPLVASSARSSRNGRPRRINDADIFLNGRYEHDRDCQRRWAGMARGFCVGVSMLLGAIVFAVAILVLWNRPLYDVKIRQIENVLATEQELIFDLCVGATNPNMLSVSISEMDLNVFAKSKHVGKSSDVLRSFDTVKPSVRTPGTGISLKPHRSKVRLQGGVDHGTDPPGDGELEPDSQTMLLGRVFKFDQALNFENALFARKRTYALGELSLLKPGNKTETGGSARWERVLQFPFELIVRGTLKYRLPISMRSESIAVDGNIIVHPEEGTGL